MKTKNTHRNVARVTETSGNVFADLGLPNPEQELLKAQLTLHISTILRDSGLTQVQIARVLSVQGSARCYSWTRSTAFFSTAGKLLQQASLWTLRTLMPSPFTKSMGFSNYRMSKDGYSFPWERLRNCFDSPPAERKRVPWGGRLITSCSTARPTPRTGGVAGITESGLMAVVSASARTPRLRRKSMHRLCAIRKCHGARGRVSSYWSSFR